MSQQTEARLLQLVPYEHPLLRKQAQIVVFPLSEEDQAIIRAMKYSIQPEQLKEAKAPWDAAVGMAANQWGIDKRIFIFCPEATDTLEVIINPSYEPLIPDTTTTLPPQDDCFEACFSVPCATGNVQRYTHIRVHYQDETGQYLSRTFSGWPARVWQHENDHLNGFLYDDTRTGKCLEKHSFDSKEAMEDFYQAKKEQMIREGKRSAKKIATQNLIDEKQFR
jgi:peptide deformylase